MASAVISGEATPLDAVLRGGCMPRARLAIHQRHYAASLATALCEKYPACSWLAGSAPVIAAARAYARAHPPQQPCIADYGAGFPEFLGALPIGAEVPYLGAFAALEWLVGKASIAIDRQALDWGTLSRLGAAALLDARVTLQPGAHYRRFGWAVDELMSAYLGAAPPERFVLAQVDVAVEIRGARGAVSLTRLDTGTFAFRSALESGASVGAAAAAALDSDPAFDPGRALRDLANTGLVVSASTEREATP
jgi:hypothetical protein